MSAGSDVLLERLSRLHPKIIDLSLERIERLLARLGHPERNLPPVVHVAGTNGKGSTVAYLRAIAEVAGLRAHAYTSPHLVRFHERIRLAGALIGEDALSALLDECERANGDAPITFFEVTTAAAFLAFSRTTADLLLLEVGLGGRLDATNVIAAPALSIITPISIDHVQFLGETLSEIAGEKAGILKPGVPCVMGPQPPEAVAAIEKRAKEIGAPLLRHGVEWHVDVTGNGFVYRGKARRIDLPHPVLPGVHQIANAGMAVAAVDALAARFAIGEDAIRAGLQTAEWPARLQRLVRGPLIELLPTGWELWLDGGHNPAAGEALAETARGWRDRPLHLVVGMINTKDLAGFLRPLAPHAASLTALTIPGNRAAVKPEEIAAAGQALGLASGIAPDAGAALTHIATGAPARVLICGSLYLAGKVLETSD
ncbi:MAG: bifunctional folylpolyglutamate synthase/dihydrofolate synthase [Alphaproteobacteria bacterium]|nr:bifunctional folylpolyglutamate synthase/dihydrofolate synthase [Alphaproteobacteria bacterium]